MTDKPLKRPRDPAQLAKLMIDIASGEVEDREPESVPDGRDPAAVSFGSAWAPKRHRDARVERVAVRLLVFLNLRLCMRHRDTRYDVDSGQCDSRALVLPK